MFLCQIVNASYCNDCLVFSRIDYSLCLFLTVLANFMDIFLNKMH